MAILPLLRDVKAAEKAYARALLNYGPNNLATIRAEIRWRDMRAEREKARQAALNRFENE